MTTKPVTFRHRGNTVQFGSAECRDAFKKEMAGKEYGYEALSDAAAWFENGYQAARQPVTPSQPHSVGIDDLPLLDTPEKVVAFAKGEPSQPHDAGVEEALRLSITGKVWEVNAKSVTKLQTAWEALAHEVERLRIDLSVEKALVAFERRKYEVDMAALRASPKTTAPDGQDLMRALVDLLRTHGMKPSAAIAVRDDLIANGLTVVHAAAPPAHDGETK